MSRPSLDASTVALLLDTLRLRSPMTATTAAERWRAAPVDALLPLVRFEGAELWLYRRWRELGVEPPSAVRDELRGLAHRANLDNMRIDAQADDVVRRLDAAGFRWALIKGQARRAAAVRYPYATVRTSSDVDLLVPLSEADAAWQLLVESGFRRLIEGPVDWHADHHRPTLVDANDVCVELHVTTAMSVAPAEAWARATSDVDEVPWNGRLVPVPSATELTWQSLAHTVADGTRGFTLRAFVATAAILAAGHAIDWARISARIDAGEIRYNEDDRVAPRERVLATLGAIASLAGYSLPAPLLPRTMTALDPLLLWRAQVLQRVARRDVRERLLEEALRREAGLPVTPVVRTAHPLKRLRRRGSSLVARALYDSWRVWR